MKFNEEELAKFKEDFKEEVKFLEKKYNITITLGNITSDDTFFSARIMCEHAEEKKEEIKKINPDINTLAKEVIEGAKKEEPKKKAVKSETKKEEIKPRKPDAFNKKEEPKKEVKAEVKKETKKQKPAEDLDINNLDLDNFVFDDVVDTPKKKEAKKETKPEPKKEEKPKTLKEDINIDDLDLDNFSFDDIDESPKKKEEKKPEVKKEVKPEPKKEVKKEVKSKPKLNINELDIENMTDEEIEDLYDNYELVDEPVEEKPKKKEEKKINRYDESKADDILEDAEEVELDEDMNEDLDDDVSSFFDKEESEPTNIFEEKRRGGGKVSRNENLDDLDDILNNGVKYSFSFMAKLIQGEGLVQDFYTDIKNELLAYKGMKSRISWDNETFVLDGKALAKVNINNNALELYYALSPKDYEDTRFIYKDASSDPKYKQTPLKVTIRRYNDMQQALEIIEDLADTFELLRGPDLYEDYHYEYETTNELVSDGYVKKI